MLSGKEIGETAYIREFAHGGMSNESVPDLWFNYMHLLKYRLIQLNNAYHQNHNEYSKIIEKPKEIIKITDGV